MAAPKSDTKAAKPEAAPASKSDAKAADKKDEAAGPSVKVEKKGNYVYWFTYVDTDGAEQTTLPTRFKGRSTDLDTSALGEKPTGAKLYVMDRKTGNMAIAGFPPKDPAKPIEFGGDEFGYVRGVKLRILSEDDKPLESAVVNITDGENTEMRAVVTPADEGVASFQNVASGQINVKVEANGAKRTIDSDIEIPDKRSTPGFEADVKVSGDVDTLATAATKGASNAGSETQGGDRASYLLSVLAALVFLIIVVVVIAVVLKAKGVTAQNTFQKLGVQMPGDQAGMPGAPVPVGPAVDPSVCEFCGQRKDAGGRCACIVSPGAAPFGTPSAGAAASGGPRLIGSQGVYSGHIFDLTSPSMVMGRESTNEIPLPNDTTASRRHATVMASNGGYSIRDEGSSNGTFVNGARITEQKLTPGDEIQVGGTKFRFEV